MVLQPSIYDGIRLLVEAEHRRDVMELWIK